MKEMKKKKEMKEGERKGGYLSECMIRTAVGTGWDNETSRSMEIPRHLHPIRFKTLNTTKKNDTISILSFQLENDTRTSIRLPKLPKMGHPSQAKEASVNTDVSLGTMYVLASHLHVGTQH